MMNEVLLWPSGYHSRLRIKGSRVQILLEARFFPNLNGTSLHRALRIHSSLSVVLMWLKYCCNTSVTIPNLVRQMRISVFNFVSVAKPQMFGKSWRKASNHTSSCCLLEQIKKNNLITPMNIVTDWLNSGSYTSGHSYEAFGEFLKFYMKWPWV